MQGNKESARCIFPCGCVLLSLQLAVCLQVNDDSDRTPQIMVRMGASGDAEVDPFSHRVIATLEEQGIPYSVVPVCLDPKPCWFYSITRNAT